MFGFLTVAKDFSVLQGVNDVHWNPPGIRFHELQRLFPLGKNGQL